MKHTLKMVLLPIWLITSSQAAIPQKVCERGCSSYYSGYTFKVCRYSCGYGDIIYELKERWIRTSDCNKIINKKSHSKYKSVCKKGVKIYLDYFDR